MHAIATQGFLFPNDIEVLWSLMIVLYPYITGLVAGAFIVSSLYHVFGKDELKPVAKFSLVAAFSFLLFACTPETFSRIAKLLPEAFQVGRCLDYQGQHIVGNAADITSFQHR